MKFDLRVLQRLLTTMKGFFIETPNRADVPVVLTKEEIDYILKKIETDLRYENG